MNFSVSSLECWVEALTARRLITRRSVIGGGALLLTPAGQAILRAAPAPKISQADAQYQTGPKGIASCGSCASFAPPASCKTVVGKISPQGWCKLYITVD